MGKVLQWVGGIFLALLVIAIVGYGCICLVGGYWAGQESRNAAIAARDGVASLKEAVALLQTKAAAENVSAKQTTAIEGLGTQVGSLGTAVKDLAVVAGKAADHAASTDSKLDVVTDAQIEQAKAIGAVAKGTAAVLKRVKAVEAGQKKTNDAVWSLRRAQAETRHAVEIMHFFDLESGEVR